MRQTPDWMTWALWLGPVVLVEVGFVIGILRAR